MNAPTAAPAMLRCGDGVHAVGQIAPNTWRIDESGVVNCYLLAGTERALLIDTGCGLGDLSAVVRSLTSLPVTAALTHRHCDHACGAGWFPACYVHESDLAPVYGLLSSRPALRVLLGKAAPKRFPRLPHRVEWIGMRDGHTFELGGRRVVVRHTPGHTRGSVVLLDEKEKLLFTGDDANPCLLLSLPGCTSVAAWLPGAQEIATLAGSYTPWCGHDAGLQPLSQIERTVSLGQALLAAHKKNAPAGREIRFPAADANILISYRTNRLY